MRKFTGQTVNRVPFVISIFKKIINNLAKINQNSKSMESNLPNLIEVNNTLEKFKKKQKKIEQFLDACVFSDPNDIEKLKEFFFNVHTFFLEMKDIIDTLKTLNHEINETYIPPDKNVALLYKSFASNIPLKLAKMEEAMEPLQHLKIKEEVYYRDSIFTLIELSDGFLTTKNNVEFIVLTYDLTIVKRIPFPQHTYIEYWAVYKKFKNDEVVFHSSENEWFLYVDVKNSTSAIIKDIYKLIPCYVYHWENESLYLSTEKGFYRIDVKQKTITKIKTSYIKESLRDFYSYYQDSLGYDTVRMFPQEYAFTFRDCEHQTAGLRNTKKNTTTEIKFYNEEVYDIKYLDGYFMFIEDEKIDIRKDKKRTTLKLDPEHFFIGAHFFKKNDTLYVVCLAESIHISRSTSMLLYRIAESYKELVKDDPRN